MQEPQRRGRQHSLALPLDAGERAAGSAAGSGEDATLACVISIGILAPSLQHLGLYVLKVVHHHYEKT